MHIALVQFYPQPLAEYRIIASELRLRGHEAWVATVDEAGHLEWHDGERVVARQQGPTQMPDRLLRLPIIGSVLNRLSYLGFVMRVRRFLRRTRPDVVQVNPSDMYWVGLLPVLMPRRIHYILDFRQIGQRFAPGLLGKMKAWWKGFWLQARIKWIYDRACFQTPAGARVALGEHWAKWATIVPTGVEPQFLTVEPGDTVRDRDQNLVTFLYLGTFSRIRRLELILSAVKQVSSMTDAFRVVFVGPDGAGGYYHELVKELQLDAWVSLEPPVRYEDVPEVALGYDVTLAYVPEQPTDWQYYPTLKVLEYRALGLPIIATDIEPNHAVVEEGVNGLLVPNSAEGWAGAMLRFVRDPGFLKSCQDNATGMRRGRTWREVTEMYERDVYVPLVAAAEQPALDT